MFLGLHSLRVFAPALRDRTRDALGVPAWRALYSLASVAGFAMIVGGYAIAREQGQNLWYPPTWTKHLAATLTLPVFVLFAAAYVPHTRIKARIGHPMVAGTKLWALAHLLCNARTCDVLLFGAFLGWAVVLFRASRARDRQTNVQYKVGPLSRDITCIAIGLVAWVIFAFALHIRLIGVAPFAVTL